MKWILIKKETIVTLGKQLYELKIQLGKAEYNSSSAQEEMKTEICKK